MLVRRATRFHLFQGEPEWLELGYRQRAGDNINYGMLLSIVYKPLAPLTT